MLPRQIDEAKKGIEEFFRCMLQESWMYIVRAGCTVHIHQFTNDAQFFDREFIVMRCCVGVWDVAMKKFDFAVRERIKVAFVERARLREVCCDQVDRRFGRVVATGY